MSYSISPLKRSDMPFMREMLYQSIFVQPPLPRSIIDAPEFKHYLAEWGKPHDAGFIAKDASGAPIGSVWMRVLTHDDPGWGYVDDATPEVSTLAVLPEWRARGVGTALMHAFLACADVRYQQVSLSCDPNNPALRLYQSLGFVGHSFSGTSHTLLRKRPTPDLRQMSSER